MTDWYNDPPEEYEAPDCCGEEMECDPDGSVRCRVCKSVIEPAPEPPDEPAEVTEPWPPDDHDDTADELCPHRNLHHECDACFHASDIAYDSRR